MQITIADRFKPFSHIPGTFCVLPRTTLRFQIYPALIRVFEEDKIVSEIAVSVEGPVKDFTVQLDLEKSRIRVWGHTATGYLRYSIYPSAAPEKFVLVPEKNPSGVVQNRGETAFIASNTQERLSLGSSKSQDWEMVKRRSDLTEILPIWFALGQQIPKQALAPCEGTAALLHDCRRAIIEGDCRHYLKPFQQLFQASFDGILSPRKTDVDYQGFSLPPVESVFSVMTLLSEGAELIRSLFFSYNDGVVDVLPALPVELHCGRFLGLRCGKQGTLDIEWTKKAPRRLIFKATESGIIRFALPTNIQQFRLRTSQADRGRKLANRASLEIESGKTYYFDRFEK